MADSITEKLAESLRRVNEALSDYSEKTILSVPDVKNISKSKKVLWREEQILNNFRSIFPQDDQNRKALNRGDQQEDDKTGVTVAQKLTEQKTALEKEIQRVLEGQSFMESAVRSSLKSLEHSSSVKEEQIVYI